MLRSHITHIGAHSETTLDGNFQRCGTRQLAHDRSLVWLMYGENRELIEGIDDFLIATSEEIAENTRHISNAYQDITNILEKVNQILAEQSEPLGIFIALTEPNNLHFSTVGGIYAYARKNNKIISANDRESLDTTFSYISSGQMLSWELLIVSNVDVLSVLTSDDFSELARDDVQTDDSRFEKILTKETSETGDIIIIHQSSDEKSMQRGNASLPWIIAPTFQKGVRLLQKSMAHPIIQWGKAHAERMLGKHQKQLKSGAFVLGIIVCIVLLYTIVGSIFSQTTTSVNREEAKAKLLQAQALIDEAGRDLGNKPAFLAKLKEAENLVFSVRNEQLYQKDAEEISKNILILKRQLNGIETIDLTTAKKEVALGANFTPLSIALNNKQLYFVGKDAIAGPLSEGTALKMYPYPTGEVALLTESTEDGTIYVLTQSRRLLRLTRDTITVVRNGESEIWPDAKSMKYFNGNLYFLAADNTNILRFRPGVNGFGAGQLLISQENLGGTIIDFAVDGGVYLLKSDGSLDKVFLAPAFSKKSIVLNKLPDDYLLGAVPTQLIARDTLNYIYLLTNGAISVFAPDSRNYKDIKSATYIGRIETNEHPIQAMYIERDGSMTLAVDNSIYTISFEVSDNVLRLK